MRDKGFYSLIIAFLPTIIAISYPIIIQTISKLNEVYSSSKIIDSFKKEKYHLYFKYCLISSLILSGLTILNYEFLNILAFVFLILLIGIFILYIELILKYSNPSDLFEHILKKTQISKLLSENIIKPNRANFFEEILNNHHEIITDLYCFAIKFDDIPLETNIRQRYFYLISNISKELNNENETELSFDSIIYNNNFKILESFIKSSNIETRYRAIEFYSTEFYLPYSLGIHGPKPFNNQTFVAIWDNIILLIKVSNYSKIKKHWEIFYNFFNLYLRRSYLQYDEKSKVTDESFIKNQKIIQFKSKIIEFNISFLAIIYYKRKYRLLEDLVLYTQNLPAKTFLLEFTPQKAFDQYFEFRKDIFEKNWTMSYYFDDIEFDSIGFQKDSKFYISEFCLILFLYSWINDYGTALKDSIQPLSLPKDLPSQKALAQKLPNIIRRIEKIFKNKSLISETSLALITRRDCLLKDIPYPTDYLNNFRNNLEIQTEERLSRGELDSSKIEALINNTVRSIKEVYLDVSRIKGNDIDKENRDEVSNFMETIRGTIIPLNREAFLSDPTIHYIDYDKILGRYIKNNYYAHILDKIDIIATVNYTVEFNEIFKAVDILNLKDHIIISANLNLEFLNNSLKIGLIKSENGLEDYTYKGIPIFSFDGGRHRSGRLFIMKSKDKPMIKHRDWKEIENPPSEFIDRWKNMENISDDLHIYLERIELNDHPDILDKYKEFSEYSIDELKKMIQFDVDFLGYCWFPKSVKIISISQGDLFQQGGDLDELKKIKPFDNV
ncbi:hypothetical protein [Algoriphagus alkaliphilus]|uniref:hypothetical protein n=1 Tax=Algoriphagus alkaliphilus TaxID=279824 RepID=UPI0011144AE9|nr:hypothetical protein [Algoriphagus alkaliphilus]